MSPGDTGGSLALGKLSRDALGLDVVAQVLGKAQMTVTPPKGSGNPININVSNPDLHQVGVWTSTIASIIPYRSVWSTLQICSSGSYLAGATWPLIIQPLAEAAGWRPTYLGVGLFCIGAMLPLLLALQRRSPGARGSP